MLMRQNVNNDVILKSAYKTPFNFNTVEKESWESLLVNTENKQNRQNMTSAGIILTREFSSNLFCIGYNNQGFD